MNWDTEPRFGEPRPRPKPAEYAPVEWPEGTVSTELSAPSDPLTVDLAEVMTRRSTRRRFSELALPQLASLLWLACRTHTVMPSPYGFAQEWRTHPSAGAAHPIHVLVQRAPGCHWERYDSVQHALRELPQSDASAQAARKEASRAVSAEGAVLIGLVAEIGRTAAKYEEAESLVWRDAGVVLGYLSLTTEALGLAFCPLGMTGDAYIKPLDAEGRLRGAGLALVGAV